MAEITRKHILDEAEKCVCQDRQEQYGEPENNFRVIAAFWDDYLRARRYISGFNFSLKPHDVAMMMALLKIGRIATGQFHEDSYIDAIGYLALAGELAGGE